MHAIHDFFSFVFVQREKLLEQLFVHIGLTFVSLFLAILLAVPTGLYISRKKQFAGIVLGLSGVMQTIPSLALLGILVPIFGIGPVPAIFALFLYSLLPMVRNTYTGITGIDPTVREAALGMGMRDGQVRMKVEIPLAMPVILAGIRTATVMNVGVATLAAYIAAGGLGEFIFGGIALNNTIMMLAGAIPTALLALALDLLLSQLQKFTLQKSGTFLLIAFFGAGLLSAAYFLSFSSKRTLLAGLTPEFIGRSDGYPGLQRKYGLSIRNVVVSDAVMYKAIYEKKLDVISGYATDGRLRSYGLAILDDDKHVFPPYFASIIVRNETLYAHPEIKPVLELLSGHINDTIMTELNYQAEFLNRDPVDIAKAFLIKLGLYKKPRNGHKGLIVMGSKIFPEQYILIRMYEMLLEGYTDLAVDVKTGLGGTQICFGAMQSKKIDLYPEYSGTGLLVILNTPSITAEKLYVSKDRVLQYVAASFNKKFGISWLAPIGFNNAYALMMRRRQSDALGIHTISALANYLKRQPSLPH